VTVADRLRSPDVRVEGSDKVTGAAQYAGDVTRPGMLHAAFVGSPHPHARILQVDTQRARAMPGVRAVLTGADVRPARFGRRVQDWPVLCWDRVRFIGDRVAAVCADTPEQAEAAARSVTVRYEELPAIFDPEEALAPDAVVLHPESETRTFKRLGRPVSPTPHGNAQGYQRHEHGDVDGAFASAARVFEDEYDIARVANGYLEPRACVVWIDGEDVHVVSTNKGPFALREQLSATTEVAQERIVVEPVMVGGDFGGKGLSIDEHATYFLARATGRPVRSALRYEDELQISGTRRAARIRLRTAVDADGRIAAHEARIVWDCGAYAAGGAGPELIPVTMATLTGYRVPAARIESIGAFTNQIPGGSSRAPGLPQLVFAAESHIDEIARSLGADPFDFRARNLAREGEIDVMGKETHATQLQEVLAILRRESHWDAPLPEGHGRGMAFGLRHVGLGRATVSLTLEADATVEILTGLPEQGTGVFTTMARVVAAELGIPPADVRVRQGNTAEAAMDPGHGGSRSTPVHGGAALAAAKQLAAALAENAPGLDFAAAARRCAPFRVTATHEQNVHTDGAYAEAVEVTVDAETGVVRIVDAVLVADVGTVINPVAVRGQLEGGFVFGLGQAVMEEVVVADGKVVTTNLGDYKLPTVSDVPPLRVFLHVDPTGPGPFGAKSVGELANPAVGAAVGNAVAAATGARIRSLPITAEKVHRALAGR
jgi:CO/xanthine dehydrogenase Mo-binding subunit